MLVSCEVDLSLSPELPVSRIRSMSDMVELAEVLREGNGQQEI